MPIEMTHSNSTSHKTSVEVQGDAAPEIVLLTSDHLRRRVAELVGGDVGRADHPGHDLRWLAVLEKGLRQRGYLIEARSGEASVGRLPLAFVSSVLFGRYLVSLPYVNSAGVSECRKDVADGLISRAVELAEELDCRYLELRHESAHSHTALNAQRDDKVQMRLALPGTVDELWDGLKSKVRSQVRKGQKQGFEIEWGGNELLPEFYNVFSRRMRDLGTPVYSRKLFETLLDEFGEDAEVCRVREGRTTIASAILVHGRTITEVPSASTLQRYNPKNVNMLMYWNLLERTVARGQSSFDFGRATRGGNTYRFKKQWGSQERPTTWQYHLRQGSSDALRPDSARNQRLIQVWKRLPLRLTRLIGPAIVRGIP